MEIEFILIQLMTAILVILVIGLSSILAVWIWGSMNQDLVEHWKRVREGRKRWKK